MSKTYIVSRNGGTVTKAPINDNKIPIYANETALDADLANIPDNTLVATRGGHDDVIDQMKEYIRKQNDLSAPETLDASLFSNGYEMPYDGIVYLATGATTPAVQYFVSADNGITWVQVGQIAGQNSVNASVSITAKKGWKIKGSGSYTCCGMFYKDRDYTGR